MAKESEKQDRLDVLRGLEPEEAFRRSAEKLWRDLAFRALASLRGWVTGKLAVMIVAATASAALAFLALPIVAALFCAALTVGGVGYAVYARRLMYLERSRRRWVEVALMREHQRTLKAEDVVDQATLALIGDIRLTEMRGAPDLRSAAFALRYQLSEARTAGQSAPPGATQRQSARPRPLDTTRVRRRLEARAHELRALEAEIRALADPHNKEAQAAAVEARAAERQARRAALAADAEARVRSRRGLPPTAPAGEAQLEVEIGPEGVRHVKRGEAKPTPEQIASPTRTSGKGE